MKFETTRDGVRGKARIALLAGEALFLHGRDNAAVDEPCRGGVVVLRGQAE